MLLASQPLILLNWFFNTGSLILAGTDNVPLAPE